MGMANAAFTREIALRALREAGITVPPVDLDDVAASRALRIERHAKLGPGVRASYQGLQGLIQVVSLSPRVERFPVAHEVGHALLDEGGAACTEAMIKGFDDAVSLADAIAEFNPETTASSIASNLLVPSPWLRRAVVEKRRSPKELEDLFDVTSNVIWIAISRDRLLNKLATGR